MPDTTTFDSIVKPFTRQMTLLMFTGFLVLFVVRVGCNWLASLIAVPVPYKRRRRR